MASSLLPCSENNERLASEPFACPVSTSTHALSCGVSKRPRTEVHPDDACDSIGPAALQEYVGGGQLEGGAGQGELPGRSSSDECAQSGRADVPELVLGGEHSHAESAEGGSGDEYSGSRQDCDIRVGSADLVSSGSCTVSDIEVTQDIRPDDSACQEASSNVPAEHGLSAAEEFAIIAGKHNLTHASTNDILDFCRRRGIRELPKDARTVMKTERKAQLEQEAAELKSIHLLLDIRHQLREGFAQIKQELQLVSERLDRLESKSSPAVLQAAPPTLPQLPAKTVEDVEVAEQSLQDEDVAAALVFTGAERAELTRLCIERLEATGVQVVSLTFDGASSNFTMAKSHLAKSFKAPLREQNENCWKSHFCEVRRYIMALKDPAGRPVLGSPKKTGFLGFLVCMESIEKMFDHLVVQGTMTYILTHKVSQDHVETFFGCIRGRDGFNNNPTAAQFTASYKRLLVQTEVTSSSAGNCSPDIVSILTSDSTLVRVRAKCFRSQKKTATPYAVSALLTHDGFVKECTCECAARENGTCHHIMGLLKVLVPLLDNGYAEAPPEMSCTELPQIWRRPRGHKIPASSVDEVDWSPTARRSYPLQSRLYEAGKRPRSVEEVQKAVRQFARQMAAHTASPLLEHWKSATPKKADSLFGETCEGSLLWSQKPFVPHDFTTYLCPENQVGVNTELTPMQPAFFSEPINTVVSCVGLPPKQQAALMLSVDEARQLEQTSRQQSQSATWKAARKNRLTASNFGVAVTRENWTQKGLENLTTERDLSRVRAIQNGVSSEAMAVQQYERTLRTFRHNIETFHCGLIVDPTCPWLGASPDRVVWDPEEQSPHGIVEVKCPYSMRDLKIPSTQGSCLVKDGNGTYRLNRTHFYYYQMYAIVEFTATEVVEVVPCTWMNGETCLWPKVPSDRATRMVRRGTTPDASFQSYAAVVKGVFQFQRRVVTSLNILRHNQAEIVQMSSVAIQRTSKSQEEVMKTPELVLRCPLESVQAVLDFNETLNEEKSEALVRFNRAFRFRC
ncbi:hypothetical protein HPB49_013150 [Dermacentor silvarum]|uniref:Uncharacterized protein n=1 Tax=Dermacentor silvarum TaxID=543639 RepID=A0ACB8CXH9_DERSI|nr:hypothetical protein HPB49_013150 [Dermacentor silvarum]